jgi:hypothetical protein
VGTTANLTGVVVTQLSAPTSTGLTRYIWVQDPAATDPRNNGVMLFSVGGFTAPLPAVGDVISASGTVAEYAGSGGTWTSTETELENATITIPTPVTNSPIAATTVGFDVLTSTTTSPEPYEHVLVNITGSFVVTSAPDSNGDWKIAVTGTTTPELIIARKSLNAATGLTPAAVVGCTVTSLTGAFDDSYSAYKIQARSAADVAITCPSP